MTIASTFTSPDAKYFPITKEKAPTYSEEDFKAFVYNLLGTKETYGIFARAAANAIIKFYKTQVYPGANFYLQIYAQVLSDVKFNIPLMREAKIKARAGDRVNVYIYDFLHPYYNRSLIQGSGHGSDQYNLYGNQNIVLEGVAAQVQQVFKNLMVSFIKTANPVSGTIHNPDGFLKPYGQLNFFHIKANSTFETNLWTQRLRFWNNLARIYGFDWPEYRKVSFFENLD